MNQPIDRVVDEIVRKVKERLLEQGLKLPENEIRPHLDQLVGGSDKLRSLIDSAGSPASNAMPQSSAALAKMIDHTLLKPDATESDLKKLCDEARKYKFATVCVNSAFVRRAAELLQGADAKPIAVVGFPLGAATSSAKAFEAREAIKNGAKEIDMVINIGELKSGNYTVVFDDIRAVVEASKPHPVKVILETALLDHDQKVIACALSKAADAAFVKTSTGFGPSGATAEDIALMRKVVGPTMGVKASGGIRTTDDALKMIQSGASRVGASASVAIVDGYNTSKLNPKTAEAAPESDGRKPFAGLPYKAGGTKDKTAEKKKPSNSSNGNGKKGNGGY